MYNFGSKKNNRLFGIIAIIVIAAMILTTFISAFWG